MYATLHIMYSLIVAVLGLVIFMYMFDVLRKRSSLRAKRAGLAAWLGVGLVVAGYALYELTQDGGMGFVILLFMSLLFWVAPTGLLLWLDIRRPSSSDDVSQKHIEQG